MSDEYSKSPKRIKLDADLTQQINDSRNNDDNSAQGSSHRDNMSSADKTSSDASDEAEFRKNSYYIPFFADETFSDDEFNTLNGKTFSCYDVLNSEWLEAAEEPKSCRIYVHLEIVDWIVSLINKNILNEDVRATVEEVFHHNLNGQVYLIKFYIIGTWAFFPRYITKLTDQLKYKCVWEKRPTYFLKIDSNFDKRKIQIMSELRKLNLHDSFEATSLEVNWLYIPKIEKYEFPEYLTEDQTHQIDLIFKNKPKSLSSLYICEQFEWHKDRVVGSYVDVDTLAMDICAEEWNRHDLLKEFELENLLNLDLAYKDYRHEFLNGYMERDIHKLLLKLMPKLSSGYDGKMEINFVRLPEYALHYFISKFYNKISFWEFDEYDNLVSKHDIPILSRKKMAEDLKLNKPTPDQLLMMEHYSDIVYNISNYNYFSDSLFRTLLNKPSVSQKFNISFGTDFQFRYEKNNKISPQLSQLETLSIHLIDCTANNAEQLAIFMKYIFNLCKDIQNPTTEILIGFSNCVLDDYSFLASIDRSIDYISFTNMNFPSSQFELLSRFLTQQRMVQFHYCNITDTNVMTLLENIDFYYLDIGEDNACTPALVFLMAEDLMNKESGSNRIEARRFLHIGIFPIFRNMNLDPYDIEFFKTDDQIVMRYIKSQKIISLYDDESFDPIYNVYAE